MTWAAHLFELPVELQADEVVLQAVGADCKDLNQRTYHGCRAVHMRRVKAKVALRYSNGLIGKLGMEGKGF